MYLLTCLPFLCVCVSHSVVPNSLPPHGLLPARPPCPWDSPGKNTGVGCHALLQGIFPTLGLNSGLPHGRWILYRLSHQSEAPPLLALFIPLCRSIFLSDVMFLLPERLLLSILTVGLPWWLQWRIEWQPTPVFLPGESRRQSPQGHKELDTTEWLACTHSMNLLLKNSFSFCMSTKIFILPPFWMIFLLGY